MDIEVFGNPKGMNVLVIEPRIIWTNTIVSVGHI
jgi:hypothetical protein